MAVKDNVLLILEANRGGSISGQAMADELGVSRNAVWKAIEKLKEEGFSIVSGNGGYQLAEDCDRLIKQRVEELAAPATFDLVILDSVDSTNNECKRRLSGLTSDLAVLAECQTEGRGRNGKAFYSPSEKGLYMSVALKRQFPLDSAIMITTYTAVCVVDEIRRLTGLECQIKWVNDIFYNGLKVCGILTEAVTDLESGMLTDLVVGIGVDLHPTKLPKELKGIAGVLDCDPIKNELAAALIKKLCAFDPQDHSHMELYKMYSLVLGKQIRFQQRGETINALAVDIDAAGGLVVKTDSGMQTLRGGEVSIVPIKE